MTLKSRMRTATPARTIQKMRRTVKNVLVLGMSNVSTKASIPCTSFIKPLDDPVSAAEDDPKVVPFTEVDKSSGVLLKSCSHRSTERFDRLGSIERFDIPEPEISDE